MSEFPRVEKARSEDPLPEILKPHPEILSVTYDTQKFVPTFAEITHLRDSLPKGMTEPERALCLRRFDTVEQYFSYPLYYKDIFDIDHEARRNWRHELQSKDVYAFTIYEQQRIKNGNRNLLADIQLLLITLTPHCPHLQPLLDEAEGFSDELIDNVTYGTLSTPEKITYVQKFDSKIQYFIHRIAETIVH